MILVELQGGVTSGFSRETSKVGRVLVVPDQEQHSPAYLARFGVAEPNFLGFSREIRWLWAGRALRRVEVVGVTCLFLALALGPCPARPSHAVRSRPSCRCRSPPQLQHFGPGTRGCLPRKGLRGRHTHPGSSVFFFFLTRQGSLWTAGPPGSCPHQHPV